MISVDPGVKISAMAGWFDGVLVTVGWRPPVSARDLVIEVPVIRPRRKGDSQDILDLMRVVERWASKAVNVVEVKPEIWKGQTPKPIHHRRLFEALTPTERAVLADASGRTVEDVRGYITKACQILARTGVVARYSRKDHNLFDAVGIGLWYLGRTDRTGTRCDRH